MPSAKFLVTVDIADPRWVRVVENALCDSVKWLEGVTIEVQLQPWERALVERAIIACPCEYGCPECRGWADVLGVTIADGA
jgi:hypothetical protein